MFLIPKVTSAKISDCHLRKYLFTNQHFVIGYKKFQDNFRTLFIEQISHNAQLNSSNSKRLLLESRSDIFSNPSKLRLSRMQIIAFSFEHMRIILLIDLNIAVLFFLRHLTNDTVVYFSEWNSARSDGYQRRLFIIFFTVRYVRICIEKLAVAGPLVFQNITSKYTKNVPVYGL